MIQDIDLGSSISAHYMRIKKNSAKTLYANNNFVYILLNSKYIQELKKEAVGPNLVCTSTHLCYCLT